MNETCRSCQLTHELVEAWGIYYCPNPLCSSAGAWWFRVKCKSYKEDPATDTHTVDKVEWATLAFLESVDYVVNEARVRMADKHFGGYRPAPPLVIEGVEFP